MSVHETNWCKEHNWSSARRDHCPFGFSHEAGRCEIVPAVVVVAAQLKEETRTLDYEGIETDGPNLVRYHRFPESLQRRYVTEWETVDG